MTQGLPPTIRSTLAEVRQWTPCLGLPMMWARFDSQRATGEVAVEHATVAMVLRGDGLRRMDVGRQQIEAPVQPEILGVSERGFAVRQGRYEGTPGEIIQIQFPEHAMTGVLQDDGAGFRLRTQFNLFDGRMAWLMRSLWESQAGGPSNTLYAEGLMLALIGLLRQDFGQAQDRPRKAVGEFSATARRQLIDLIEHGLGETLSVQHLADAVQMSPQHFARLFIKTFGQPPHAYVMSRRMDAAKRSLVNEPERSVADIAVSCGFASAAHFSRCFKQALGTTPTRWRQQ